MSRQKTIKGYLLEPCNGYPAGAECEFDRDLNGKSMEIAVRHNRKRREFRIKYRKDVYNFTLEDAPPTGDAFASAIPYILTFVLYDGSVIRMRTELDKNAFSNSVVEFFEQVWKDIAKAKG